MIWKLVYEWLVVDGERWNIFREYVNNGKEVNNRLRELLLL